LGLYSLIAQIHDPEQQKVINKILRDIQKEFSFAKFDSRTSSKKLIPFEIVMEITVSFGVGVGTALVIKCLEELWKKFEQNRISLRTQGLDAIQEKAQNYLREVGITDLKILRRENRGPYSLFVFKDEKGQRHHLKIASSDLCIIEYTKR